SRPARRSVPWVPARGRCAALAGTTRRSGRKEPDHRHRGLLRASRERPRGCHPEKRYEFPPPHSITSSARASSEGRRSRPKVLAVLRLITSSNLVGCSTGKSDGLAPLKILSTKVAARREISDRFGP